LQRKLEKVKHFEECCETTKEERIFNGIMPRDKYIKLHKEYGLNPAVPVCIYCGKERNEVVLLGAAYKGEAPRKMIIDDVPCSECEEGFKQGVTFFEVVDKTRTGRCATVKEDSVCKIIPKDNEMFKTVMHKRAAYMDPEVFNLVFNP
jgi:hypothetical protein